LTRVRSATYNLNYANNMTASRNVLGQLTQMTYGNNLVTNYTYDSLRFRLTRIQAGSWLTLSYGYDAVGNVTAITDTARSTG
jgi:YD repeat-containing protein